MASEGVDRRALDFFGWQLRNCDILEGKHETLGVGMTRSVMFRYHLPYLGIAFILAAVALTIPQAQARPLPTNSKNHTVLCTCGDLLFTSSNVVGNVSIANDGAFIGSTADGPGSIIGTVGFAAANTGQYLPDGIAVTGGATFGNASVQNDISNFNTTSQALSGEEGAPLIVSAGGSVNASAGVMDEAGNKVFTATIDPSFVSGTSFTITGTGDQTVAINIPATGTINFAGSILLAGGITPDDVLFNFDAGDFETNTGGPSLVIGAPPTESIETLLQDQAIESPPTMGQYFDPNGSIDVVNAMIDGRVFGGPTDFEVTNSTIIAPAPEPGSLSLVGAGLAAFGVIRRRKRARNHLPLVH